MSVYKLTPREEKFLKDFSGSPDGLKLKALFLNILKASDSVAGIKDNYAAEIEGRKMIKDVMDQMITSMTHHIPKKSTGKPGIDEYE